MPTELVIVMNLAKTDLHFLLHPSKRPIRAEEKRTILYQLFNGLAAIHKHKIIHRDIKPGNVLITNEGIVQIADFGLSVPLVPGEKRTSPGGTLFYKAIELLMDDDEYDEKVDMWAAGCSMAELWTKDLLFKPSRISLMDQTRAVSMYLGFPEEKYWPRLATFKLYREAWLNNNHLKRNLLLAHALKITQGDALAANLLLKLVNLYPSRRISASDCLTHGYFTRQPPVQPNVEGLLHRRN
ncbi:hypothetical protein LSTR_LSTR017508 [Laodelphax striatellus]|uniref:Protein kinase domain-containing protein n=1 Tax=Laodelphax striatellus TaxID=195883 RepID=A0A482WRW0_LAOST|nr:hypothetical protein LSTR_LSTR017508 [Laodelphax striatellus]